MQLHESSRVRLYLAIAQLANAADELAATAFSLDTEDLTDDGKALRDYYARVSTSLHDTLNELKVMAARRRY